MKGKHNIFKGDILRNELQFPVHLQLFHYLEKRTVCLNYINFVSKFLIPQVNNDTNIFPWTTMESTGSQ